MLDKFLSPLWFATYTIGSILCVVVVAHAVSIQSAITLAGFLIVFGTLGIEYLTREKIHDDIYANIEDHKTTQISILKNLAETEQAIEDLQKNMSHMKQVLPQAIQRGGMATTNRGHDVGHGTGQSAQTQNRTASFFPSRTQVANANQSGFIGTRPATTAPAAQKYADILARKTAAPRATPQMTAENNADHTGHTTAKTEQEQLPQFTESVIRELVQNAVTHDRIELFAQPIVRLPSRKIHALEVFARIRARAGVYVPASQYRKLAIEQDLLVEVDRILLQNVLDSVRVNNKRGTNMNYFINISTTTLKDFTFMSKLLQFLRTDRDLASNLIFEFRQNEFDELNDQVKALLKGIAQAGCQFSIDNLREPRVDFDLLRTLNVRYAKIDSAQLISLLEQDGGTEQIHKFKTRLDAQDITLIVEKVETERDVRELLDFEIDFGAGFLFGRPDLEIAYRPKKTA